MSSFSRSGRFWGDDENTNGNGSRKKSLKNKNAAGNRGVTDAKKAMVWGKPEVIERKPIRRRPDVAKFPRANRWVSDDNCFNARAGPSDFQKPKKAAPKKKSTLGKEPRICLWSKAPGNHRHLAVVDSDVKKPGYFAPSSHTQSGEKLFTKRPPRDLTLDKALEVNENCQYLQHVLMLPSLSFIFLFPQTRNGFSAKWTLSLVPVLPLVQKYALKKRI